MKTKISTPKTGAEAPAATTARKRSTKATTTEVAVAPAPVAPVVAAKAAPQAASAVASPVQERPVVAPPAAPKATSAVAAQVQERPVAAPQAAPKATLRREITSDLIAKRAYIIWEQQGRPQGRERDNWLLAESQLKQEIQSFTA